MTFRTPRRHTRISSSFDIRTVAVEPGGSLPYDAARWRDALVIVREGEIVVETARGRSWFFTRGDILCVDGLALSRLYNRGSRPAVLVAASRRTEMR